jgi:hypothetical protein
MQSRSAQVSGDDDDGSELHPSVAQASVAKVI